MARYWLIVGLAMALLVGILTPGALQAQGEEVVVSVEGPEAVEAGETFSVRVNVAEVVDFDVAGFRVVFDPAVLAIDDINPGADITNGSVEGAAIPVVGANQIAPGAVYVLLNVPGIPGVSGSGYLAELRFRAVGGDGTKSAIEITNLLLGDKTALEIPSRFAGPLTVTVGTPVAPPPPTPEAPAAPETPEPAAQAPDAAPEPTAAPVVAAPTAPAAAPLAAPEPTAQAPAAREPATQPTPIPPAPPAPSGEVPTESGFQSGGVIAIVVVVVVILAAAAVGGFLLLRSRRQQPGTQPD